MGFIKYSVTELGVEEDLPGWVKKAKAASDGVKTSDVETADTANIKEQEQSESDTKDN